MGNYQYWRIYFLGDTQTKHIPCATASLWLLCRGLTQTSKLQLPLPMNMIILLGVTGLVALAFLVIAVLHYFFGPQLSAFDINMGEGGF